MSSSIGAHSQHFFRSDYPNNQNSFSNQLPAQTIWAIQTIRALRRESWCLPATEEVDDF